MEAVRAPAGRRARVRLMVVVSAPGCFYGVVNTAAKVVDLFGAEARRRRGASATTAVMVSAPRRGDGDAMVAVADRVRVADGRDGDRGSTCRGARRADTPIQRVRRPSPGGTRRRTSRRGRLEAPGDGVQRDVAHAAAAAPRGRAPRGRRGARIRRSGGAGGVPARRAAGAHGLAERALRVGCGPSVAPHCDMRKRVASARRRRHTCSGGCGGGQPPPRCGLAHSDACGRRAQGSRRAAAKAPASAAPSGRGGAVSAQCVTRASVRADGRVPAAAVNRNEHRPVPRRPAHGGAPRTSWSGAASLPTGGDGAWEPAVGSAALLSGGRLHRPDRLAEACRCALAPPSTLGVEFLTPDAATAAPAWDHLTVIGPPRDRRAPPVGGPGRPTARRARRARSPAAPEPRGPRRTARGGRAAT